MIPLATTLVDIDTPATTDGDGSDAIVWSEIASKHRATFSTPIGSETSGVERVDAILLIDPSVTVEHWHRVYDRTTGEYWQVSWVRKRVGLGLDHQRVGLVAWKGVHP